MSTDGESNKQLASKLQSSLCREQTSTASAVWITTSHVVNKKRDIQSDISFFVESARRGSNPRPPPWQGGAPPLSHSRMYLFVTSKYEYTIGILVCQH